MNDPAEDPAADPEAPSGPEARLLGRDWIGPALLAAGLVTLVRVEVLAGLASADRGLEPVAARWAVLADWPAEIVQAGLMAAASCAVVWGAPPARRLFGMGLAICFLLSALTGWPIAPAEAIPTGAEPGVAPPLLLAVVALGFSLSLAGTARLCRKRPALASVLGSTPVLAVCALVGIGGPSYLLHLAASDAPRMSIRDVVLDLGADASQWTVVTEAPRHAPSSAVLSSFADPSLVGAEFDTGDRLTLVLPPPLTVEYVLPPAAAGTRLRAAAQLSGGLTDRGVDLPERRKPSRLDDLGLASASVRFTLELDGEAVLEETIVHRADDGGAERTWRHLGEGGGGIPVAPGQRVTLRTDFADDASRAAFAELGLACGFGDLLLERWEDAPRTRATPTAPNLLFITIDTLRSDRMSGYGYRKPTTPFLDELARSGLLYERAFATSSWTWPSTASLFTGLGPYEHGVLSTRSCRLDRANETLAEVLQQRGYTTAAIACNPLIDRSRLFDQGFERFDDGSRLRKTDEVLGEILATLDQLRDVRFFLYLHLVDPHTPHAPLAAELERLGGEEPEDFPTRLVAGLTVDGMDHYAKRLLEGEDTDASGGRRPVSIVPEEHARWISDRYDASVGTVDQHLGDVLRRLEELGLDDRTVIAVTSDHGEELFDHGGLSHGHALWRELVQVPLILAGPGIPEGVRVKTQVSNRHLAPTLAQLGGAELEAAAGGVDLTNPDAIGRDVLYQTSKGYWNGRGGLEVHGWRDDEFSVHYAPQAGPWQRPPAPAGEARIFSIEADRDERTNLIRTEGYGAAAGERITELRAAIDAQRERRRGADVGVAGLRELERLGYTGTDEEPADTPPEPRNDEPASEDGR